MPITTREELGQKLEEFLRDKYRPYQADALGVGFYSEWETGGYTGGSCYGDESRRYTSSEREGDFLGLDEFLTEVKPDISFLQYKHLLKKVKYGTRSSGSDYYGNSTEYGNKFLAASDVVEMLGDWLALPPAVKVKAPAAVKKTAKKKPRR